MCCRRIHRLRRLLIIVVIFLTNYIPFLTFVFPLMLFSRLRIGGRRVFLTAVGVPALTLGGLGVYVQYRLRTRPSKHVFKPVVTSDGVLLIDGRAVQAPSRATIAVRLLELFVLFVPLAFLYVVMRLRRDWYNRWLLLLLRAVQRAGPAFVKAGQWSCTRSDIFSPEFQAVFKRLYNEVDVHPYSESVQVLREELQKEPEEIFSSIEEIPVGSGSIGQVHLARLRGTDERVVIKVMHPNVVETIVKDFCIINGVARLFDRFFPALEVYNLPSLALAWTSHLAAQLDFRLEAKHLDIFRENFRNEDFVEFPRPLFSTQRVLVETFCEGEPATPDFLAAQEKHTRDILAHKGLNTWCKMLLRDSFVHGDMHPGNILIDVSDPHTPRVSLIDVGLCQTISSSEAIPTRDLMEAFVRWNPTLCCDSLLRMGTVQKFVDAQRFREEMHQIFDSWRPKRATSQVVTNVLQAIFECIRDNRVQMDPSFVSLLFSVLVLESFIMNLNPNFNMVRHAAPWLVSEGHMSRGLVKNFFLTKMDVLKQEFSALRGRMRDGVHSDLTQNKNVHISEW